MLEELRLNPREPWSAIGVAARLEERPPEATRLIPVYPQDLQTCPRLGFTGGIAPIHSRPWCKEVVG